MMIHKRVMMKTKMMKKMKKMTMKMIKQTLPLDGCRFGRHR